MEDDTYLTQLANPTIHLSQDLKNKLVVQSRKATIHQHCEHNILAKVATYSCCSGVKKPIEHNMLVKMAANGYTMKKKPRRRTRYVKSLKGG